MRAMGLVAGGDTRSLEAGRRERAAGRTGNQPRAEGPRLGDSPSLISKDVTRGCSRGWEGSRRRARAPGPAGSSYSHWGARPGGPCGARGRISS